MIKGKIYNSSPLGLFASFLARKNGSCHTVYIEFECVKPLKKKKKRKGIMPIRAMNSCINSKMGLFSTNVILFYTQLFDPIFA